MSLARSITGAVLGVLLCVPGLSAQEAGTITGRVVEGSTLAPISGATVSVAETGALTNASGRFVITGIPAGTYTLRVQQIGYADATEEVTVGAGETVNVTIEMTTEAVGLGEIVVTSGYGEQQEAELTGVIQAIEPDQFNPGRVISPEQLIQGKVAGVNIIDSGEPGGGVNIRIRGGTSITSSNEPLFVIDGVPLAVGGGISAGRNPLNFLNPDDIARVTVLKDASATAIYGSRGANGVILIETKGGRASIGGVGSQLSYRGTMSGSTVTREPDMLSTQQFRDAVAQYVPTAESLLGSADTDWRGAIQRTALGQEHALAIAGATSDFDYRLSVGYLDQQGVVNGTDTERATLGLSYGQGFFNDNLRISANIRGARTYDEFTPGGAIGSATQFAPTQPIYDEDSPYGGFFEWTTFTEAVNNPVAMIEMTTDRGTTLRSVGDLEGQFQVPYVDGLTGNIRFGYDVTKTERETFRPSDLWGEAERGNPGFVSRSNNTSTNVLFDAFFNYDRTFEELGTNMEVTGGYSYEDNHNEFPYFEAQGLSFDYLGTNGIPAAAETFQSIFVDESRLISFFGRTHFTIDDTYMLTLSVRHDGSSKFGPDQQWGTFPSAAVAWRLTNEPFLQDSELFSDLKLRLSWGQNGNQAFGNYQQYPTYDIGTETAQYQFGDEFVTTIRPGAADRGIKWEQTTSYNVGMDYGLMDNRFTGSIEYYYKETDDLIFRVPVAAGTFTSNFITTNIGSLTNSGVELTLDAVLMDGEDDGLYWNANFNAATNTNEITQINPYGGGDVILTGGISGAVGNFIQVLQTGHPVNTFYVYEHKMVDGQPLWADENNDGIIDGNDIYVDQNNDGIVNQDDRRPYKSPAPKWILGHTSTMQYGSVDASFTVRAHLGNYVYNNVASNYGHYRALEYVGVPNNLHSSVLDTGFEREQYFSDYYVQDASFLRLDNLTVGYTFQSFGAQQVRVFGTAQNLFTLTGYDGVDPLAGVNGIDNNLYPRSRTLTVGASVQF